MEEELTKKETKFYAGVIAENEFNEDFYRGLTVAQLIENGWVMCPGNTGYGTTFVKEHTRTIIKLLLKASRKKAEVLMTNDRCDLPVEIK